MKTYTTNWTPHENAMLSNVQYYNSKNDEYYAVIWKDLLDKNKHNNIEIINEPTVPIYFVKPEFRTSNTNRYVAPLNELERQCVRPSLIPKIIATEMGPSGMKMYRAAVQSKDWRAMKEIFKWPHSFGADYPPEMFYRIWWMENCSNDLTPYIKTAFSDIEVDIIHSQHSDIDSMVSAGDLPINVISIYYAHENDMHIYVMIPDGYMGGDLAPLQLKSYVDMMNNWDGFMRRIHDTFDAAFGKINYVFHWYPRAKEIEMLIDYFVLVNKRRPDFTGFWNMPFDMPYIISRCAYLGTNPMDVICDPEFPIQKLYFKKDTRHFDIKESNDFLHSSTATQYICLMRNYAKHRKQFLFQSYSLDAISGIELGEGKIKYGDGGATIKTLAYTDFMTFILYNIKDTLLTKQIDRITGDLEYTWIVSNSNYTSYNEIFAPSMSLRCVVYNEFLRQAIGEY